MVPEEKILLMRQRCAGFHSRTDQSVPKSVAAFRLSMINRFLSIAALILGCFFFTGCENDLKKVDSLLEKKTGVEEAKDIEAYLSEGGKTKAKLLAPLMLRVM